jgi:protein O-mannosyl-transferase
VLLLAAALAAAWGNSFTGPFVFDDIPSLHDNPSIRSLSTALSPPTGGLTVSGRPLLNLSFAVNYALSGEHTASYHALNLCIHLLAALALFGLVRRTLRLPVLAARFGGAADRLALAIALLWAVHPLQTESVTYLVQRAESLTGMFYLLVLYCFVRSAQSARPARWLAAGAASCLLGALTKESIATAPLLVLLFDRTFVSGSFRASATRHRGFYAALAASWLVTGALLLATKNRGGTVGFDAPVSAGQYGLVQLHSVANYLQLAVWPHPLVFDRGPFQTVPFWPVVTGALVVVPCLLLTGWALVRRPMPGFLGAAFFLVLAPGSSFVPLYLQIMAEHRIYLALAAVVTLAVLLLHRGFGRYFPNAVLVLAAGAIAATAQRNNVYRSGLELWTATVRDCPSNPRANLNLGQALLEQGRWAEAAGQFEAALRLQPDYVAAHNYLGLACLQLDRLDEAGGHFASALRLNPAMGEAAYNWGNALARAGRMAEAAGRFEYALRLDPGHARAHYNLGNALIELGRPGEAVPHYRASVRLDPAQADAHFNLANALFQTGRPAEAVPEYEAVLRLAPQDAEAARNLALARQAAAEGTTR